MGVTSFTVVGRTEHNMEDKQYIARGGNGTLTGNRLVTTGLDPYEKFTTQPRCERRAVNAANFACASSADAAHALLAAPARPLRLQLGAAARTSTRLRSSGRAGAHALRQLPRPV